MKKSTHWITIPEEKLHTPASEKKGGQKSGKQDVKNKLLWGIGFVVIVVVAFALLAPDQFNSLLKGSLFDTSGVTEEEMKVSLVPSKSTSTESTSTESTSTESTSTTESTTSSTGTTTTTSAESTVKPEEKAVSISVTPVSTTTSTTTTTAKDCGTDITCFLSYLKDCTLATVSHSYKVSDEDFEADLEITGSDNTDCTLTVEFTESPEEDLVGEEMTCKLAQGDYTQAELEEVFSDSDELSDSCTGDAADTLKTYLDSLTTTAAAATTTTTTTTSDSEAVEELKKQLEALTKIVAETQTKPAAATTTTTTPATTTTTAATTTATTTTPTSVATTTAIGQPSTVTPGFTANTHTVSVTPQQMLQQNLASGVTYSQAATTTTTASSYQTSATSTVSTTATPQTGPSEVILMTLILTFLGLVGWRFVKIFA